MICAVIFDLDETLLDRTTALRAFLADQYGRFARALGRATLVEWQEKFLKLDSRGMVQKSVVYPAIIDAFGGSHSVAGELLEDYETRCCEHAVAFEGMADTLKALRARGMALGVITNGQTEFQTKHIRALGNTVTGAPFTDVLESAMSPSSPPRIDSRDV